MSKRGRYRKFRDDFEPEPWHSDGEDNLNITVQVNPENGADRNGADRNGPERAVPVAVQVAVEHNIGEEIVDVMQGAAGDAVDDQVAVGVDQDDALLQHSMSDEGEQDDEDFIFEDLSMSEDENVQNFLTSNPDLPSNDSVSEEDANLVEEDFDLVEEDVNLVEEDVDLVEEDINLAEEDVDIVEEDVDLIEEDINLVEENVDLVQEDVIPLQEDVDLDHLVDVDLEAVQEDLDLLQDRRQPEPPEEEEDDNDDNEFEFNEVDDYETILQKLSKEWLDTELDHTVSKTASDAFWAVGKKWFHKLFSTKALQNVRRKTPTFTHIRRQLYDKWTPPVKMEFGFKHKDTGAYTVVEDSEVTPKTRFPANEYDKMWEIAYVEVRFNFYLLYARNVLPYASNVYFSILFFFVLQYVRTYVVCPRWYPTRTKV